MKHLKLCVIFFCFMVWNVCTMATEQGVTHPNVLFIAVDDLNDWIGCMGGHAQARTPNIDALAAKGMLFTNAHCAAPACNPSRTAIMTGRSPHTSGLYANGDEELYDCLTDPYEWNNLAASADHVTTLNELRMLAPKTFAPLVPAKDTSLPKLTWHAASDARVPASRPDGDYFDVVFINQYKDQVNLHVLDRQGNRRSRGSIASGWRLHKQTKPGSVWLVTDTEDTALGFFMVQDRSAQAVIPKE